MTERAPDTRTNSTAHDALTNARWVSEDRPAAVLREGIGYVAPSSGWSDLAAHPDDLARRVARLGRAADFGFGQKVLDAIYSPGDLNDAATDYAATAGWPGFGRADKREPSRARDWVTARLGFEPPARALAGVARIVVDVNDDPPFWRPFPTSWKEEGDEGLAAVTLPVLVGYRVVDVLALAGSDPARWWPATGLAALLGRVPDAGPVRLTRTPFAWLQAQARDPDSRPVCILDLAAPASRDVILYRQVICDDEVHAGAIVDLRETYLRDLRRQVLPRKAGSYETVMVAGNG